MFAKNCRKLNGGEKTVVVPGGGGGGDLNKPGRFDL